MEMEAGKYKITPRPSMGCQISLIKEIQIAYLNLPDSWLE